MLRFLFDKLEFAELNIMLTDIIAETKIAQKMLSLIPEQQQGYGKIRP